MRRSKIRRNRCPIIFIIVATCVLCLVPVTICDDSQNAKTTEVVEQTKTREKPAATIKDDVKISDSNNDNTKILSSKQQTGETVTSKIVKNQNKTTIENSSTQPEFSVVQHPPSLNPGALQRGFYVFVGLSVIALAYIVFRSLRLNKNRPQMVRKYGILAHKQDIEMRPLPLDEDDEDDTTVFDASSLAPPRPQP